ncbi:BOI2 [Candida pseudojiufengensis]|uniref:BOI2 n=1 Tax=Candida pseudojiufengensis TaxID=497109 RepID=UPI002225AF23|nr:BOI2 [Candida pseudojiufengensis]KAI5963632.1 BOI2 [Candida pseudojiufengensis]
MDGSTYICIKQFNARLGDELSLKIGDKIQVLADDREYNDGWYMGKNLLTGDVGLYPKTFTQIFSTTNNEDKTLLRSRSRRVMTPPSKQIQNENSNDHSSSGNNNAPLKSSNLNPNKSTDSNNNVQENFEKLNLNDSNGSNHLNNEIDRALEEIQGNKSSHSQNNNVSSTLNPYSSTTSNNNHKQSNIVANSSNNGKQHIRNPSAQSLTDDLNPLQASNWTPKQVSSYFQLVLGYDKEIASKFAKHRITGQILFELDLGHLKELEIDSFGTRFEIHKEIEKLKEMSLRSQKLKQQSRTNSQSTGSTSNKNDTTTTSSTSHSSPTELTTFHENDDDNTKSYDHHNHQQNFLHSVKSNQNELMPSAVIGNNTSSSLKHQRKRSQSMDNSSQHFDSSFVSPRRPPQPPSETPMDTNYKFGAGSQSNEEPPTPGLYMTRTNASNHALNSSRPASSVYDQGSTHNRQFSQTSNYRQHHKKTSSTANNHRRHSSLFSFLSGNDDESNKPKLQSKNLQKDDQIRQDEKLISPAQIKKDNIIHQNNNTTPKRRSQIFDLSSSPVDIDDANMSPKKSNSISMKTRPNETLKDDRRVASEPQSNTGSRPQASRLKSFRTVSTQNFRNMTGSKKSKTSAFTEGIRDITPDEAIKSANHSGYMSKRSSNTLAWRQRYFTLHGTRLSYFTSLKDKKEKGLIDITAHKVIPINSEADDLDKADKYAAMYASTTMAGSFCFKIVPPAPGFKKGLTFTQPKTHYFAVESEEDMRGWIKALMTATIDIDDSVPVVSSCSTPTVSLTKAQEMLAKTREENKLKDEELRAKGYIRGDEDFSNDTSFQSSMYSTSTSNGNLGEKTALPKLTINTQNHRHSNLEAPPLTPNLPTKSSSSHQSGGGFASPYLLASGYLSPRSGTTSSPSETPASTNSGYFADPPHHHNGSTFKPPSRQNSQNNTNVTTTPNMNNNPYTTINTNRYSENISSTPYSTASSNNSQSNIINPVTHINGNGGTSSPRDDINNSTSATSTPSSSSNNKALFSNSAGKVLSGRRKEKMMAFSSDGSGNHTFVIKPKK